MIEILRKRRVFILYIAIGSSGVIIDFLIFVMLTSFYDTDPVLANVISTSFGITNNFVLNALYNFKKRDSIAKRFVLFYGVGLIGLLLSTVTLQLLHVVMGVDPVIAKVASLILVLLTQYTLNKKITFSDKPDKISHS